MTEIELKEGLFEAVEGLMQFFDAMDSHELSIMDLKHGIELALGDGYEYAALMIAMANQAMGMIEAERKPRPKP